MWTGDDLKKKGMQCKLLMINMINSTITWSLVIGTNLLWGAVFSRGLSGLVAMLASSASQLVFGEQLNSWWDTPAATWNTPGDLWSSSTSCRSGMSSKEVMIKDHYHKVGFHRKKGRKTMPCFKDFTIIHVTPRWRGQVLVALQGVKGLVHSRSVLLFLVLKIDSLRVYSTLFTIF